MNFTSLSGFIGVIYVRHTLFHTGYGVLLSEDSQSSSFIANIRTANLERMLDSGIFCEQILARMTWPLTLFTITLSVFTVVSDENRLGGRAGYF